jgi:hypothetical protein
MSRGDDARRPIGHDARRETWTPTDRARGEALVAQHGGALEVHAAGGHRLALTWRSPTGATITVEGPDGPHCVRALATSLDSLPLPSPH